MATPFPNSKIELHRWANSILLGMVAFFVVQTYNTISKDHEVLANHEVRISVLEANKRREKQTSYYNFDAILPDKKIKVESE